VNRVNRVTWVAAGLPLVLKKVGEDKVRALKAEAARRGISLSKAVEEAIELWLRLSNSQIVESSVVDDMVWEKAREELEEKFRGRYVVIFDGKIQGVFDSLEQVARFLREKKPRRAIVVRPGVDGRVEGEWLGGSLEPL